MKDPKTCTHKIEKCEYIEEHEDRYGDVVAGHWHWETVSTMDDIDLHRMKCSQCGTIGYYSGAARDFHEKGITSQIRGLDGKKERS